MERFRSWAGWRSSLFSVPFTYLYIVTNILISVSMWCGQFAALDALKASLVTRDKGYLVLVPTAAVTFVILYLTRAAVSLVAGPLTLLSDNTDKVFSAATLYDTRLTNTSYRAFAKDQVISILGK